jgi:hypothetical protein
MQMVSVDFRDYEEYEQVAEALQRLVQMRLDLEWSIFLIESYLDRLQQHS